MVQFSRAQRASLNGVASRRETWRARPDGSIDLAVITGFQIAATDGAIAVRLDLCRSQEQLAGRTEAEVEQVVITPAVAAELIAALQEQIDAPTPLH
ncbi:hypothetical protein [Brevundimonas sp. TWP2-3-4b1]|uniref:hypothetical protein n=1 Tax=Brevundimonas sp. TWP2-3-4b1 TaxID=2804580 RepID=UPI003CF60CDE